MPYNRRMRRRAAGVLPVVGFLVTCAWVVRAEASSLPDRSESWITIRTAHFTLFSNASEESTVEIGTELERFRSALTRLVSGLEFNSPVPTYVYVFKHDASFTPYKKRTKSGAAVNITGAFAAHRDGNYVGINATPPDDPWTVIYHEYAHYFLYNNFTDIPLWFNEGVAECLSTFRARNEKVEIGRPIDEHLRLLKSGRWMPLSDLFAVEETSKDYNEGDRQGTFYAESWALVHYLAWGRPDAAIHGIEFLAQFPPRADLKAALGPILGPDWGELNTRVLEYLRHKKFTYSVRELDEIPVEPIGGARPMSYAETLSRLGDYLMRSQFGRVEDAQAHYQAAIQADPAHAAAYSGMGFVRDFQGRHKEAAEYYEKALAKSPDDGLTLFLYAESLLDGSAARGPGSRSMADVKMSPAVPRARDLYLKSIRLRPEVAEAYVGLGATYTLDEEHAAEGIDVLQKARRMMPSRLDVVLNLAGIYARSGEAAKARELVQDIVNPSGDREAIDTGREILLEIDLHTAEKMIKDGDLDGGLSILKTVEWKSGNETLKKQVREEVARLESVQLGNQEIGVYNQAVVLANAGNYKKAAAILEPLAKDAKNPQVARNAKNLLKKIRDILASQRP
jgi:tetratricopeptide (TPR) repeat protein